MNQSASPLLMWLQDARRQFDEGVGVAGVAAAPGGLADDELVAATAELESLGRLVDGLRVAVAGEVAGRSDAAYGDDGLSRAANFATPAKFLAAVTGVSVSTASSRVRLAAEVHTTFSVTGLPNPPRFPRVAEALASGALGIDAASAITRRLKDVASRTGFTEALEEAEGRLVSLAQQSIGGLSYTADEVDALALRTREHLDPDGAEPRESDLHARRYLTLTPHPSGMTKLTGCLPPSSAAILRAALEPFTSPRIVAFTDPAPMPGAVGAAPGAACDADADADDAATADDAAPPNPATLSNPATSATGAVYAVDAPDAVFTDTRTRGQKTADALVQLVSMAAGLPELPRINGAAPTVNVHATLDDIVAGRGVGWVDGLTEPVPHTTVETLLCHADTITTLFGQHGQVLQHGKTKRLFTTAQNRALAARDGGCVWPGCTAPPSWCESHHVDGWLSETHPGGLTDIDNGALLCHFHHSHVHKTGWILSTRNGTPHLTPPDTIDWTQTPRPCQQNRARQTPTPPPGPIPNAPPTRPRKHHPPDPENTTHPTPTATPLLGDGTAADAAAPATDGRLTSDPHRRFVSHPTTAKSTTQPPTQRPHRPRQPARGR